MVLLYKQFSLNERTLFKSFVVMLCLVGCLVSLSNQQQIDLTDQEGLSLPSIIQSHDESNHYMFKTNSETSSNLLVFVLPCEGQIDWFVGNETQVSKAADLTASNSLHHFIYPKTHHHRSTKDDIIDVAKFLDLNKEFGIAPGNTTFFVKVTNSGKVKARYNLLYSTTTNPYPILPSSNSITVTQNGSEFQLSWNPVVENADNINYCVYSHHEEEHQESNVHGSACAVFSDSDLMGCTRSTNFKVKLKTSGVYHLDVIARRRDNGRSWAYLGKEVTVNSATKAFTSGIIFFLLAMTLFLF